MKFELFKTELNLTDDYELINSISLEFNHESYSDNGYYGLKNEIKQINDVSQLLNSINDIADKYIDNIVNLGLVLLQKQKINYDMISFKEEYQKKYFDFNNFSKEIEEIPDSMMSLVNLILAQMGKCISGIFMGVCSILDKKKFDIDTALLDFDNVKNNINNESKIDEICECIKLYPYNEEYYKYLIDTYYDPNNEVEKIAKYFGFTNIEQYKRDKVETLLIKLKIDRQENGRVLINEESKLYGIDDKVTLNAIKESIKKIEDKIKTVEGIYYQSFEKAEQVRRERYKINQIMQNVDENNLKSLREGKEKLEKLSTDLKNEYLQKINSDIDRISKTIIILGEVYEASSIEEAEKLKQEVYKLENIFSISKYNYEELIEEIIKANLSKKIEDIALKKADNDYLEKYNKMPPSALNVVSKKDKKEDISKWWTPVIIISIIACIMLTLFIIKKSVHYLVDFFQSSFHQFINESSIFDYIKEQPVFDFIINDLFIILLMFISAYVIIKVVNRK